MSAQRDELAARKALLVAQSALYRSQVRAEVTAFQSRSWLGIPLKGALMVLAGRSSMAGWIGAAGSILGLARMALSIFRRFRK